MGTATLEVSGPEAARWAADLRATLAANARSGENVSPVEVRRSAEMVTAVIGLAFAGVGTAKTIWDWWNSRRDRDEGTTVTILLGDGTHVDISTASQTRLEIVFRQNESRQG
ncbi:hypothetical protein [Micromonospora zhanjiangensis]|uniref:PH domain-containing protein n=1 Tax=Micromonospora zhanjiangensis TaxID=1522057 RepID=A0ABV8KXC2_9ACTN